MTLYLIRHGETLGNQQKFHQSTNTPLSEIGLFQAERLAHRFKKIKIDTLFASPYKRAQQTAKKISAQINLPIISNDLFKELLQPKEIFGLKFTTRKSTEIRSLVKANQFNPDWHYSDEENLAEFKQRVLEAKLFLASQKQENILVASHSFFISMFLFLVATSCECQTLENALYFSRTLVSRNCGISVLKYEEEKWRLATFNDHAHLG